MSARHSLITACFLLFPAVASAQLAPGAFTTLRTTDVTGASMCVGCAVGSTTPADNSGITATTFVVKSNVGAPSVTTNKIYNISGALYFNGLSLATGSSISGTTGTIPKFTGGATLADSTMTVSGANFTIGAGTFTAGLFSGSGASLTALPATSLTGSIADARLSANVPLINASNSFTGATTMFTAASSAVSLSVRNTTSGATNTTFLAVGNDADASAGYLKTNSSTFTTSGLSIADSTELANERTGGLLLLASNGSGIIRFGTIGTERGRVHASGGLSWGDATDPGATNFRVAGTITGNTTGTHTGAVVGNASTATTAGTVTTAAQPAITSLGILTALNIGNTGTAKLYVATTTAAAAIDVNNTTSDTNAIYQTFDINGVLIGSISRVGATSAVAYNTTSDRRLKNDLGITTDLSGLRALRIHDFTWKADGSRDRGVFAQEAYGAIGRGISVGGDENHPWQVDYSKFVPDLVAGWQQHDAQVLALEARIAALEAKIDALLNPMPSQPSSRLGMCYSTFPETCVQVPAMPRPTP